MGISVDDVSLDECDASDMESVVLSTEQPVDIALSIEQPIEIASSIEQPIEIKNNVNGKRFILRYHARNLFTSSKIIFCSIIYFFIFDYRLTC
jgi:hypothetical protein